MDLERKSLRIGAAVIVCAIVLRLGSTGFFRPLVELLRQPGAAAVLMFLETGRVTKQAGADGPFWALESPAPEQETTVPAEEETDPPKTEQDAPVFTAADMDYVNMRYVCDYRPDLETLLLQELGWDLWQDAPTVLILHTHTTESYTKTSGENYEESGSYRTLDENYNMLSLGDLLTEKLEAGGLKVLHDRTLHDYPSYNGSYDDARKSIQKYLAEYPSIQLVIDLHRDAADTASGQLSTSATVNGQESAQLMMFIGTNESGLNHPNWQRNLSLALKLHVLLERENPGLTRPIVLRAQRFNQDSTPWTILVEVGAAGDTHQKAVNAISPLAEAILELANAD